MLNFGRMIGEVSDDTPKPDPATDALDLNAVWSRGARLLRANWQLITVIAGLFVLVPGAALQFTMAPAAETQGPLGVLFDPASSDAMREKAAQTLGELLAPFARAALIAIILAHFAYATIVALIGSARPTVGAALAQAARVLIPLVAAAALALASLWAGLIAIQLVLMPLGEAVAAFLGSIIGVLFMLFVTARLMLTLPVMVAEKTLNPVKALLRSWRLTAKRRSNVFGFWMIMAVVWFVTLMLFLAISIAIAGMLEPGPTATLIEGLMNGAFTGLWGSVYCAMGVAMHRELAGPLPEEIASSFE